MVRFVAANLTAPAIDIYLDDEMMPAAPGMIFEDGTDYVMVPAGPHTAKIVQAGDPPDNPVFEYPFDTVGGGKYALATHDYFLDMLSVLDDDAMIPMGMVRMQLTHIAPDLGQIDVYAMTDPPTPLFTDLDYAATQSLDIPAGAGAAGIDVDDDMIPDMVFTMPDMGGDILVDVYVINENGGSPVFLLAHLPDGSTARIDADSCGDGFKGVLEVCDGADLGGMTCVDQGFVAGDLGCLMDCSDFDVGGCSDFLTFCSNIVPADIPDNDLVNGLTVDIDVPDMITIGDVDVSVDISHTWLSDLDATISLGGTTVPMFSDIAAMGGGGCLGDDMLALLDDEAGSSIETDACINNNVPAVDGTYTAEGTLSDFDGMEAQGTWSFYITDDAGGDTGVVNEVCVRITAQ